MNFKRYSLLLPLCIFGLTVSSCGNQDEPWTGEDFQTFTESVYVSPDSVTKELGEYHSKEQIAYIQSTWDQISKFANGYNELSTPDGIVLSGTTIKLSENKDFTTYKEYTSENNQDVTIYNLLSDKVYYYKSDDDQTINEFKTSSLLPRNMYIQGVTNVRDIGGYNSSLGGKIKQGMIYRGGRLTNGKKDITQKISDYGLDVLVNELGVKTELDLRGNETLGVPPENGGLDNSFFKDLEYLNVPMLYDPADNLLEWKTQIRDVFNILADKNNYPLYFHCSIGTDRTGLVAYLLGALLGMNNDSLNRDYLFSNFGLINSHRDISKLRDDYFPYLKNYKKANLQRCTEAYLMSVGVSSQSIQNIKDLLLEK